MLTFLEAFVNELQHLMPVKKKVLFFGFNLWFTFAINYAIRLNDLVKKKKSDVPLKSAKLLL